MRIITRFFASALAAAGAAIMASTVFGSQIRFRNLVDYRVASGRKSSLGGRSRSKYMPHQGEREIERHRRQIAKGSLRVENGLSA